nr:isoprenylcysteine carboxylmethyltransferase family protein [Pseudoalteromonas sp. CNC9-20]
MQAFTRGYLAIFFTCVAVFYTLRIVLLKRKHGEELIFPGQAYCGDWWNHMAFRVFRITIWLVCLIRWPWPQADSYLGILQPLYQNSTVIIIGTALMTGGFISAALINLNLNRHWRSGIDRQGPQLLQTQGVYSISRNPMFVGVGIAQLGFFMALPSAFSLLCLIVGWLTLYRQTQAEEAHLCSVFGERYRTYQRQVRRWI